MQTVPRIVKVEMAGGCYLTRNSLNKLITQHQTLHSGKLELLYIYIVCCACAISVHTKPHDM